MDELDDDDDGGVHDDLFEEAAADGLEARVVIDDVRRVVGGQVFGARVEEDDERCVDADFAGEVVARVRLRPDGEGPVHVDQEAPDEDVEEVALQRRRPREGGWV